jgi:thymidylate synthase
MNNLDATYLGLVNNVLQYGSKRETRAGPTRQLFGETIKISALARGYFPILTSRKIFYKPVFGELAAFLRGATDLQTFKDFGCNYWDANAEAWEYNQRPGLTKKYVGQIYGAQWRSWQMYDDCDQIAKLITGLKTDPLSRRHLITAYDPYQDWQCLPPCHLMAQFNVTNDSFLDCIVYMRSVDLCLGLPSDIILYATLMLLVAQETEYYPGTLTFMLADTHIYENHIDGFKRQLIGPIFDLPKWELSPEATVDNFEPKHINLIDYQHGDKIDYPFAT